MSENTNLNNGISRHYSNQQITEFSEKTLNVTHQSSTQRVKRVGHLLHQNQEKVVTVLTNAGFFSYFTFHSECLTEKKYD